MYMSWGNGQAPPVVREVVRIVPVERYVQENGNIVLKQEAPPVVDTPSFGKRLIRAVRYVFGKKAGGL